MARDYHIKFVEQELVSLDLEGKRVLEVGCGRRGEVCQLLVDRMQPGELTAINREPYEGPSDPRFTVLQMDALDMAFADDTFDVAYSLATFEHVHNLPGALAEIQRVLKPDGLLIAVWGPIWNGFDGHHYGPTLSSPTHTAIDLPWAHHILGADRLADYLTSGEGFSRDEAQQACLSIFESSLLNRLCVHDYRSILADSGMAIDRLDTVQVEFAGLLNRIETKIAAGHLQPECVLDFFRRTPNEEILTYKLKATLRKPA